MKWEMMMMRDGDGWVVENGVAATLSRRVDGVDVSLLVDYSCKMR